MIQFNRRVKRALPYNRRHYLKFWEDDVKSSTQWYGVSFQLPGGFEGKYIGLTEFLKKYEQWFKDLILKLDNGSSWIVNHDKRDVDWFPNDDDTLTHLRALFKENNVPNTFRGALILAKDDLLEFSRDLISYPYAVLEKDGLMYENLDISHSELPLIIKISDHLNIDLLSTDKDFLRELVNENSLSYFILIQYRYFIMVKEERFRSF